MSEPTIDEMLEWLDSLTYDGYNDTPCNNAIQAILKQHRTLLAMGYVFHPTAGAIIIPREGTALIALEAIRAFVERVSQRYQQKRAPLLQAMLEELAAMEKETQTQ